ncbi:hypothetical protein CCY01nite_39300 [Chitinophaga cymbidii]|uniref:Uncharacterized protein n=1 Tax=Chitinophaga cymbidii TaxID=1096750 RepID=A0A512RPP8_9BACT|nr:hypothetical protein CCY01nite_39300 [Chitinophaga cymbidii]
MSQQKTKRLVLSEGETIGHKHVLESKRDFGFTRTDFCIFIQLIDQGILTHDEHDRIVLEPGSYRSYNQVEFNPMDNTVHRVFD